MFPEFPSAKRAYLRRRLLAWFDKAKRDLPWRASRNPYRIWVSEIMLQQTQVATVTPYYQRFLKAFPTLRQLALASERSVLRVWEGLGYYRRAHHLHQAAKLVVQNHHGRVPSDLEVFGKLPGVGKYMVGAILSQAFECRVPVLEANSLRVLSRLLACRADPRRGAANRQLWEVAEASLPRRRVGDFNQALMELGALVCTGRDPQCPSCPVSAICDAHRLGLEDQIPAANVKRKTTEIEEAAVAIRSGRRVLLAQRPPQGRWPNFWEFPHGPVLTNESYRLASQRIAKDLAGLAVRPRRILAKLTHTVTRFRIKMVGYEADKVSGRFCSSFYQRGEWAKVEDLADYPMSTPQRRLANALAK